jgi:hypothetical protein
MIVAPQFNIVREKTYHETISLQFQRQAETPVQKNAHLVFVARLICTLAKNDFISSFDSLLLLRLSHCACPAPVRYQPFMVVILRYPPVLKRPLIHCPSDPEYDREDKENAQEELLIALFSEKVKTL